MVGNGVSPSLEGRRIPERYRVELAELQGLMQEDPNAALGKFISILAGVETDVVAGANREKDGGVFSSDRSNFEKRYVPDYERLEQICFTLRLLGNRIVLTSGSFDMAHIGHARYLEEASRYGDVLIVGVDSDEKIRQRKGPSRPIVPEDERLRTIAQFRGVGLITLKPYEENSRKWSLISRVKPDILIATEGTYTDEEIEALEKYNYLNDGGKVVVLPPQAETSTTARLRQAAVSHIKPALAIVADKIQSLEFLEQNEKDEILEALGAIPSD